jgi:hypothetical protein
MNVDAWVELAKGGRVTSRHPRTNREIVFDGPGRFRACVYFEYPEEAWLAEGTLRSMPRQEETPSAQQWLITPSGALDYDGAEVEVRVTPRRTSVGVSTGTLDVWTGDRAATPAPTVSMHEGSPPPGWTRLGAKQSITLSQSDASPGEAAQTAIDRCLIEASAARAIAAASTPASSVGSRRAAARQTARAACGVAALRVSQLPPSTAREAMVSKVSQGQVAWRSIASRSAEGGSGASDPRR